MGKRAILAAFLLAVVVAAGCETGTVEKTEPPDPGDAVADATRKVLEESEAGRTEQMQQMAAQVAEMRNLYAETQVQPDFIADIAVAVRLNERLSSEAGKRHADVVAPTLSRLRSALTTLMVTAPARRIQQNLERAEIGLIRGDLQAAGRYVLAAAGTASERSVPALVPDVFEPLNETISAVKDGDPSKAMDLIESIVAETEKDPTVEDLNTAHLIVVEAQESLRRKAWPILLAQTAEITNLLDSVEKRAIPVVKDKEEEEAQPEEPAEEDAEAPEADEDGSAEEAPNADATTEGEPEEEPAGAAPETST